MGIKKWIAAQENRISRNRQSLRSVLALGTGNVTSSVLATMGSLLAARFLGPAEIGLFRSYTIPLMYLTFLHLGTFDGLWRQIPYFVGKKMQSEAERLASAAGAWNICISAAVSGTFLIVALHSLWRYEFFGVFGWLSQAIFCWGVFYGGYLSATYRTIHQFAALARIQVAQNMLSLAIVFTLPFLKFYGLCARSAIPSIMGVWLYHRKRPLRVEYRFDARALKDVIKVGLPFSFWGSLDTSLWVATENALMLYFGGAAALGLFAVAVAIREVLIIVPHAVHQVLAPRLVESFARKGNARKTNAKTMLLSLILALLMSVIALAVSLMLDWLVPLVIPMYAAGIGLMKLCLWFSVIAAAAIPSATLFAAGRPWLFGSGVLAGIVVFPISAYLLVPYLGGALAVAAGSLIGRTVRIIAVYVEIVLLPQQDGSG